VVGAAAPGVGEAAGWPHAARSDPPATQAPAATFRKVRRKTGWPRMGLCDCSPVSGTDMVSFPLGFPGPGHVQLGHAPSRTFAERQDLSNRCTSSLHLLSFRCIADVSSPAMTRRMCHRTTRLQAVGQALAFLAPAPAPVKYRGGIEPGVACARANCLGADSESSSHGDD